MQFRVVFSLAFATLAVADALPGASTNPNRGTINKGTIFPPFPGKDTIGGSECSSGHLRCCKFYFPKIFIELLELLLLEN